nr:testis-expressed protein 15 isoform X3 [Oryctolagus cuniculus]
MASNKMEMKEITKPKALWKMSSPSEPSLFTGVEVSALKKFTIPKIRKTAEKVYLSPCCTNTREYSFIHDTLNQCRLDVSCDLQLSWQFGDTKLVHNEDLEKKFTAKRSEMRENGRHGRELEEHFCFLALPQSDVAEIYQKGISTKSSTLKILGNPLLGIYIFRHVDIALNYAHSHSITVENIIIFKVLFGKVKKIQPSVDKNKVALDPSPNFDCHMSRSVPSLKDTIELQAYSSMVYFYEYSILSKPVDRPRQCLPYAIVTVKFIGQRVDNGHLMTSLRFLSTGLPKRAERPCSLNNCTVAKRIGKGKDATVIFEHFRKPTDPFVQENCSCNSLNSEKNLSNSDISNSYGNIQNGNISTLETYSGQADHDLTEIRGTAQANGHDSNLSCMPNDNRESVDGDLLLNLTYLKSILSSLSTAFPLHNNPESSTVITSKLIKDPRLTKREESLGKQKNTASFNEIVPFEKSLDCINSEINLSSVPTNSTISSEVVPGDPAVLANCVDAPCFRFSVDETQSQVHHMDYRDNHCITPSKVTMTEQWKDQGNVSFPISLSNVVSDNETQKHSEEKSQRAQQRSSSPFLIKHRSEPYDSYKSANTYTEENSSQVPQELQSSNLKTVDHIGHQISTVFPLHKKESIDEYIQSLGKMRNFTEPEENSRHGENHTFWKEINYFTNETKVSPVDNCISLNQEYEENDILDSFQKNYDKILISQELEIPKSFTSTTKDPSELDHPTMELQNNLTPSIESLSQNQHSLEYDDSIHTNFPIAQKLMELNLEKADQNCVNILTDGLQEAENIPQDKEVLVGKVISSCAIETAYDNSNCSVSGEYTCVHENNENEPMSLENIQRDNKQTLNVEDECQYHTVFCNAQLNNETYLSINYREQRDSDKENKNEDKKEYSASSSENSIENICVDKKDFHTNINLTSIDEERNNKNYNKVETPCSEGFSSTVNLIWGAKYESTEAALLESKDTDIKQKDTLNTGRSVEHLDAITLSEIPGSSVCVTSNTTGQVADATLPVLNTSHDHQIYQPKKSYSSENPDFGVSDSEIDIDKNKLQDSFHHAKNENLVLQSVELENEIELGSEQDDDAFLFQQDTHSHESVLDEEFEASYEALKCRIDWEGLLGSSNGETGAMESTARREDSDQHCCKESNSICFPSQKNTTEMLNPILLPDLQVTVTNIFRLEFSPTFDYVRLKDNFYKSTTDSTKQEINKKGETPGFEIFSQLSGENSAFPCEDKSGNIRQESGPGSKSEVSLCSDLSQNPQVNLTSERQNRDSSFTKPSDVTIVNDESSFKKSKTDHNETNKKDMESRTSKRKLRTSFRSQNIPHNDFRQHEICRKKRRLSNQDSSECFSSLSQGRIKTFSLTEKHIRNVLDILNNEASLCKSKRLSRKLDRAVLHLKKAHRRVHTSLQLIAKVGEKRKGPLPKAYAIICNSFWESCDLQGYSPVSERRYYSTKHFLPKRKYDKQGEKKASEFDVAKSLTSVSKHNSYKTNGERIKKCLSKKSMISNISRSQATVHVTEFCHQEHRKSQVSVSSASRSTSQSIYINSCMSNPLSSELQPFSGKTEYLFPPDHPVEELTEKENHSDRKLLSNISKYENLENCSPPNNDATKETSEASKEINDYNSISSSCMKENNINYSIDKNDEACLAHKKVKTDILISVLESNVMNFLNYIHKRGKLILSGCKMNLEVNFPIKQCPAPFESSRANNITGNFHMDPLKLTLIANKKHSIPQLLSATPVMENEEEYSKSNLDEQGIFAVDSCVTSMTASNCQQICDGKELLKTKQCSLSNCFPIDGNETNVTENSELDLTSATEESKNYRKNIMKKPSSNADLLILKDNREGSSRKCIAKRRIKDRKKCEAEQTEKAKNSRYKKRRTETTAIRTAYKNPRNNILEDSRLNDKITENNLIDSHVSIKNTVETVCLNSTVSNQLKKRKEKEGEIRSSNHPQSDYISQPSILEINHMPVSLAHSETSEVITLPTKPTLYTSDLIENHYSVGHMALLVELSQILQRADEATSLQLLQEESMVCQNMLPLFVQAFEKKQECSLEQILITREVLVEQNLWDNCKHKLKPCAVDTLVELQMIMETIQFIENKRRLLEGEVTFRSLLWYDDTLYGELLGRPRGYQQQSSFYPGFQGRLKYNAFCEMQNYHNQLIELCDDMKRKNNSYYAFLKYKRQISECKAVLKNCSDCFDFSLSVPFTCGVNFGDTLGDLENVRKSTLKLISLCENSTKTHLCPGKQDHLWIIIEMISSKVNFIKSNEAVSIKIALFGLEHIFFDAAKNLVWKEKRQSFSKEYSQKNKEMLLKMNQCAFSKFQEICDTLSEDLNSEQISSMQLEEATVMASRKSEEPINKAIISIENCRFNNTSLSHLNISCVGEILDQAEFADFEKLQDITMRCTEHLETLKKYFQVIQENMDNIFITEENVLDVLKNHKQRAVILKPAAIETYIEILMLSETVHFLKNSIAKKLDKQRFRGMLWFDLSLLPELVHCQENMASFSFLKDNSADCLWKVIETAISEVKKDLDIICKYSAAVNCSYAFHLFSREFKELTEIKNLVEKSEYSISTYIDFVPYIASINYGNTVTELEQNYSQFSALLKNVMAAPQKDLGKMAHIMKVMKTIEHLKIICVKNAKLAISFILCQVLSNRRSTSKLNIKGNIDTQVRKPRKNNSMSSISMKRSVSEYITKSVSNTSKKQPVTADNCEDSQEKEKNTTVSSCKKQKVNMKDETKINRKKIAVKHPRIAGYHPQNENQVRLHLSDNRRRKPVSPEKVEMQRSPLGSVSPLKNLKESCTTKAESKVDSINISLDTSEHLSGQQGSLNRIKKRHVNFTATETKSDMKDCAAFVICEQKSADGTFLKDLETPPQIFLKDSPDLTQKSSLSNIKPGNNDSLGHHASVLSKTVLHFDIHSNLEVNDTIVEFQDNEILNSSIKNSTCTSSPEPVCIQDKIPVLEINKIEPGKPELEGKCLKDTLNPSSVPFGESGDIKLNVNQRAECSFFDPQTDENSKVLAQNAASDWNGLPQLPYTPLGNSSEHSFGTSYPYYAWCVYHYSSSSGNAITQTYQGITSYQVQPPPGMITAVASTVQNTNSNHLYSQSFSYFSGERQANGWVPVNGYFQSPMPVSYNFQQPTFSQYASHQPLPQTTYPYPPNTGVLPEVPWVFAPWQQEPFHPGC